MTQSRESLEGESSVVFTAMNIFYLHDILLPPPPLQLTCPVTIDQISLLQLLSSTATQEFWYYKGTSRVEFWGADGEAIWVQDDDITLVSNHMHSLKYGCVYHWSLLPPPSKKNFPSKKKT